MVQEINDIATRIDPNLDGYDNCLKILRDFGLAMTADHVAKVAAGAVDLASRFGEDIEKAETAGIIHDVSTVIPTNRRVWAAEELGISLYEEERQFPMLIHQKLSARLGRLFFGVEDQEILDAVSCHTTLRANPTRLDMIVFLSDKIHWDQEGEPPYKELLIKGLDVSLEQSACNMIKYMMKNENKLAVVHPWLRDAYDFFQRIMP